MSIELHRKALKAELDNWEKRSGSDAHIAQEINEHSEILEQFLAFNGGRKYRYGLDVGVGCYGLGILGPHLTGRVDTVVGIDPLSRIEVGIEQEGLKEMVSMAREKVHYVTSNGEDLPFSDESYDIVACINVIDHAKDPARIVSEINRVLKPGGVLLFSVSTLSMVGELLWKVRRWIRPDNWHFVAHPHTFQWGRAHALISRIRHGRIWNDKPSLSVRIAGHGRMSFWLLQKS